MPKAFRKEFRTEGCTAHIRKRKSGKTHWNYEVRYRRHGYNITASANNLEEAKMKFLVKLKEAEKTGRKAPEKKPASKKLGEFADYIFETYYKRKVTAETYKNTLNRYRNHIEPILGRRRSKRSCLPTVKLSSMASKSRAREKQPMRCVRA